MAKLDTSGNPTSEVYDYQYETSGRLLQSTFAQTPASGFTPAVGATYYDGSHPAQERVRAIYSYDGGGRTTDLTYYADTWNGSNFTSTGIYENSSVYDPSLGLKTSSMNSWAGANNWTENYGYDSNFDYLISANYNDGLPNASPTWTYDAAGNRTDSVCDNLNRPTTIGGVSCSSDILGNRLSTGTTGIGWDCLNRMISLTNSSGTESYNYRADGMRVSKSGTSSGTVYRYDGQMGIEDVDAGSSAAVTDYALGARGIDAISKTVGNNTTVVYPVYDAHGNMMGDVSRNGSSFSVNDKRSFDAWGNIRQGASSGDPKGRYCANLGHKQDDESGLVYMRARYYEPTSGRFISEDPHRQGPNWFNYCRNSPTNGIDFSGNNALLDWLAVLVGILDIILIAAAITMDAPALALIIVCAVLAVIDCLLWIVAFNDVKAAFLRIIDAYGQKIKNYLPDDPGGFTNAMNLIDDLKTNGSLTAKLAACDLEMELYLVDCFD